MFVLNRHPEREPRSIRNGRLRTGCRITNSRFFGFVICLHKTSLPRFCHFTFYFRESVACLLSSPLYQLTQARISRFFDNANTLSLKKHRLTFLMTSNPLKSGLGVMGAELHLLEHSVRPLFLSTCCCVSSRAENTATEAKNLEGEGVPMQVQRSHRLLFVAVLLLLCVTVLFGAGMSAQEANAKIVGTVTDAQSAVVEGVEIKATNLSTNVVSTTISGKDGYYQILNLPIGTYHVVARHPGFRTFEANTSRLEINQSLRLDFRLEIGAVNEQVTVESQASGVETVNPTLGQSVTERPVVNMPLNGRDVLTLALLQPGVTDDNPDDTSASHGFNIAGGRTDSITYLLDGGINNDLISNGAVLDPNPDAIAEFRILTSNYTAEYGRNGAGIISVVTKSGSNQFHGSAFEFVRNTDFDANAYFNIQQGLPRNNLKRNQFGGTFGGPIVKNRLFFFASYQGQRQVETDVEPEQTVFTPAELTGDFSQAANGGPDPKRCCIPAGKSIFSIQPISCR